MDRSETETVKSPYQVASECGGGSFENLSSARNVCFSGQMLDDDSRSFGASFGFFRPDSRRHRVSATAFVFTRVISKNLFRIKIDMNKPFGKSYVHLCVLTNKSLV